MAKTAVPPPVVKRRGNKITVDLDQVSKRIENAAEQAEVVGKVTFAFARRLRNDIAKAVTRAEEDLRRRVEQAKQEVGSGKQ